MNRARSSVAAALIIGAIVIAVFPFSVLKPHPDIYAVLRKCLDGANPSEPSRACVPHAVSKLLRTYSADDVLRSTEASTTPIAVYRHCHSIAHEIGRQLYQTTEDLESALAQCNPACGFGCTHGALSAAVLTELGVSFASEDLAHLSPEEIVRVGRPYCTRDPALCHGIGHLLFASSHDYKGSVAACDNIAASSTEKCYRGLFMEGLGGQAALARVGSQHIDVPKNATFAFPCDTVPLHAQHACYAYLPDYQSIRMDEDHVTDGIARLERRMATCRSQAGMPKSFCIEGIGYSNVTRETPAVDAITQRELCATLTDNLEQKSCVLGEVAGDIKYLRFRKVFGYCASFPDENIRSFCVNAAFNVMRDEPLRMSDASILDMCEALEYPEACKKQFSTFLKIEPHMPQYEYGLFGHIR